MSLTYEGSGVDYDALDAFKRACQRAAATTTDTLAAHGAREADGTRGESAYLVETDDAYWAHVEEGLGTKNLVADAVYAEAGRSFYKAIGVDTVATIVNDLVTCGASPLVVAMHAAAGDAAWFSDPVRARDLAEGFAAGCRDAGAAWGGGETPALRGIVVPGALVLAGSALGRVRPKALRIAGDVREGDAIIALASSGVHTNGLTLCRTIAERLPRGYATRLDNGRTLGETLLDPSVIYARFVRACQRAGVRIRYAVHVTGHGWRKLMRPAEPFVYRLRTLREPPLVFRFLMEAGPIEPVEAYATFNMGIGFAVYVREGDAEACLRVAAAAGYEAWRAGTVYKEGGRKAVEIEPLGLVYDADTLQVR
ncbi:MAG TPA: AIR synthase-related protein [Candidatus Limnocylindria bacterium]|nr:AIR synthase-related protein [Candidatus Limnocylindria bacterium]